MMFKGNKVWLHVGDDRQPIIRENKVLIKYQLDQDHEYWVPKEAVQPIDPARLRKKAPKDKRDGACSGNPGPAGIGILLRFGPNEKEISKHIGITTNNVAELTAIRTALMAINTTHIPVRLYTDSQYCYGLLSLGWKPKRNEKLVAATKKLMGRFEDLRILKIEGHAGIDDNERADRLAREGVTDRAGQEGRKT